jgi:alpha-beta hydrolase superfamily lysophospholipase
VGLFGRSWIPETPERALLVVHGLAEHSGRYDHLATWFAERGSAVYAYDHRGHGLSDGAKGHLRRFDDYLDDLALMLDRVRAAHPDLPLVLLGHSMGGLVVAAFVRERKPQLAAAVTSGAALRLPDSVSPVTLWMARILGRLLPRLRMANEIDADGLSRDPAVGAAYLADPLVFRKITTGFAAQLFQGILRTEGGGGDVRLPMLMLHGEADPICPVEASRSFFADLDPHSSRLRTYPELRHEIFNEPEREAVYGDVLDWLRERKV